MYTMYAKLSHVVGTREVFGLNTFTCKVLMAIACCLIVPLHGKITKVPPMKPHNHRHRYYVLLKSAIVLGDKKHEKARKINMMVVAVAFT